MRRCLSGLACVLSLASVSRADAAVPSRTSAALLAEPRFRLGQSVGSPTDGRLVGGSRVEETPYLRVLPVYATDEARWGLGSLVALIDRCARSVRRQFPDAVLSVGHLSRRGGGDIDRHASHESGRDADLSFYIRGQTNHPLYSDHMVSFRGDGTAPSWPGAFFDDARNWALVSAIVQEQNAHVTYIFVAAPLRARLLAYAAHAGAPLAVRNRAAELMVQPRGSLPHDDHFHVRIGCPAGMTACIELPTHPRVTHVIARHAVPRPSVAPSPPPPPPSPLAAARTAKDAKPALPLAPPAHAAEPAPPLAPADEAPPAPSTAAVLATPFDDVDGPPAPAPGAAPVDLR